MRRIPITSVADTDAMTTRSNAGTARYAGCRSGGMSYRYGASNRGTGTSCLIPPTEEASSSWREDDEAVEEDEKDVAAANAAADADDDDEIDAWEDDLVTHRRRTWDGR